MKLCIVPARVGLRWVRDGLRVFARAPLAFTGLFFMVMAAAVADFRPSQSAAAKTKKRPDGSVAPIELVQNPDILAGLVAERRRGQLIVGFAAFRVP